MLQIAPDQLFTIALRQQQAGRLEQAEATYRQILAQDPNHSESLQQLGMALLQAGQVDTGVELLRRAVGVCPTEAAYWHNLGVALQLGGRFEESIEAFRRALALRPRMAEAHYNLGRVLFATRRYAAAVAAYRQAVELRPDYLDAKINLGAALQSDGQVDEALDAFRAAAQSHPASAEALNNLGLALHGRGEVDEALRIYRQALQLRPDDCDALNNLGIALQAKGEIDEAIATFRQALQMRPHFAEAHYNLANALHAGGRLDEALAAYRLALRLNPDSAEGHNNLGIALKDAGQIAEALASHRKAVELQPQNPAFLSTLIFALLYAPAATPQMVLEEARRWNQRFAEPLRARMRPHANDRNPERPLRIGYISPDFRQHCQSFFTMPLLGHHDPRQVHITAYADVRGADAVTQRLQRHCQEWRTIAGLPDQQVAELIRGDRIDILVDLAMHMRRNRLGVLAEKPAPVQVCWLAYPGTTGLDALDYRLTDPHLDPPEHDGWYSERSIRLPDSFWCYDPLTAEPAVGALPAAMRGPITFGCLNNFCKVQPGVLEVWARVLEAVPGSRLLLLAPDGTARERVVDVFRQNGIGAERIEFAGFQPRRDYLRVYQRIDIGLDTFPVNGHTTSLDALWMGVPVVTLAGQTALGRAGVSQLLNLGLPELIAASPEAYVRIAADLAGDRSRLAALRGGLRQRMAGSPLMNGPRFARGVEAAYRQMWKTWCAAT